MKWTPGGTSQDVEDRRDEGGGGGGFQFGGMHLGIGGALILLVLSLVFKQNFFALLGNGGAGPSSPAMSKPNAARDQQEQPPGQFAQAYVLAHEIGHHVQKITGIESRVRQMQHGNPRVDNALSVKMELQADCLAGVWAHSTQQRDLLEQGDVQSALGAASAVG